MSTRNRIDGKLCWLFANLFVSDDDPPSLQKELCCWWSSALRERGFSCMLSKKGRLRSYAQTAMSQKHVNNSGHLRRWRFPGQSGVVGFKHEGMCHSFKVIQENFNLSICYCHCQEHCTFQRLPPSRRQISEHHSTARIWPCVPGWTVWNTVFLL